MNRNGDLRRQQRLIAALAAALEREHGRVERFETHISWVLVAGGYAYKFKKAVRFDFLDFTTLAARAFYCREEVRLNMRLAPAIYLDALAVAGSPVHPRLGADGAAIEYCVRMRAFPQEALWTHRLRHGLLCGAEIDDLACAVAQFHRAAACAPADARWGAASQLREVAADNVTPIASLARGAAAQWARELADWGERELSRLEPVLADRKRGGFVRECHGDLHSGNILTLAGRAQAFDCIEFNEGLRWIDVINDIAFIYMDLRYQGRAALAARFLNRYLEAGGDYEGVRLLRYYQVQRALVRCKVALLRARQSGAASSEAAAREEEGWHYLRYAHRHIAPPAACIMITHGFSGSGKSVFARQVVECAGALQLRSDVERKRLYGTGRYDAQATAHTYARLLALARLLAAEGMPVVVDAAFLRREQRRAFMELAGELDVPFRIFDVRAGEATMRARVARRQAEGIDASDAGAEVLQHQLENHDPLSDEELRHTIAVDTEARMDGQRVRQICAMALAGARR